MVAARSWSSQKPGSPIWASNSCRRAASASGSKVITDPGELGPDFLQLIVERLRTLFGHASMVPDDVGPIPRSEPSVQRNRGPLQRTNRKPVGARELRTRALRREAAVSTPRESGQLSC